MIRFSTVLFCLLSVPLAIGAQDRPSPRAKTASHLSATTSPPSRANADFSKEPFVIELYSTTARFENDGTSEKILTVRVRAQSEAGAQQLHQLVFSFDSADEAIDVRYVRVRKPDGTVVNAAADSAKDATSPIARDAPAYSSNKVKQITVPPLTPGDVLEYKIATRVVKTLAPGEFWFAYDFVANAVVGDERLEINVPQSREVVLKYAPVAPYETVQANGRTIYHWKHANLKSASADPSSDQPAPASTKSADVDLTTFTSWEAVARWYAKLAQGGAEPTPEIRAKAEELTQEKTDPIAKIQALYDFVATKIRYVELPLSQAGSAPHTAAEVFSNKYGDSADEYILLAALLKSAGISSDAVLIPYTRKLDASVPSPAQLDHVITAVPLAAGTIWVDTTTEVAPFQLLASPLRDKSALLISTDGAGKIVSTPADPPFLSTQQVNIDGGVNDLGKLTARAHYAMRGDTELVLRLAFHRTPRDQWKQLAQTILSLDGIHGDVTTVKPGDPLATHDPFEIDIDFAQQDFFSWATNRAATPLPLLVIGLPDSPADAAKPIELGSPLNVTVKLNLTLPPTFTAQPPVASATSRDFADFKSSYKFDDHTVTAERSLNFKLRQVPAAQADDYRAFARAVAADQDRSLVVTSMASTAPAVPASASADDLIDAALALVNAGEFDAAIPLLQRAVELDPHHKQAWFDLGLADQRAGRLDDAVAAYRKQLELNPADPHVNDYLGIALEQQKKLDEAAAAFRRQVEIDPLDANAHIALGGISLAQRDFARAAIELEKGAILSPDDFDVRLDLGRAYLNSGELQKALAAFAEAGALHPSEPVWNDIAFNLADAKLELDKAQQFAERALRPTEAKTEKIDSRRISQDDLYTISSLGAYWDTLGWVYFEKGDLDAAERYIRAAWLLDQNGEMGDHLAQIYEKRGDKDRAVKTYALALAAPNSIAESRARLTLLLGSNAAIDDLVTKAQPELAALRTVPAGRLLSEDARADFFIALSPGEKIASVEAVQFISGSEALRPMAEKLRLLDYGNVFPGGSASKIVRRATLSCTAAGGECSLTLIPAGEARAAK